ncbi:four-carbon acid sugar kinase family protein [Caballeronia sp. LZ034LL]|uniref:four-carbon acid sugar kinase family protein n=1 Tax=Caballeronia sp. LZ034LL TaxID=3038567 RepID=UPI002864EBB4|nr:four-carbon acid sugar kinase family protein [Caballeronia sp. LZ034LL]MDR5835430.1 four-carbon acid sugar kinase family protein [Caballeronia sp. LZ034LL]
MSFAPYGFYGDDFTGATDTLATLHRAGLRAMLFVEPPTSERLAKLGPLDAIGLAGAARTLAPSALRAQIRQVAEIFSALRVRVMHYKVCSTFDSAPETGNIAVAMTGLRERFTNPFVPIIGGQPNLGRYCAFGTLFATAGGSEVHRIDRHPAMSRHPVTPMHEADLRLHFERLGLCIGAIDWRAYALPDAALKEVIDMHSGTPLLFDVLDDTHLRRIGTEMHERAASEPVLAVGASSVAQAWTLASASGRDGEKVAAFGPAQSSVFVLAGSLSPMTAAQIDAARSFHRIELDPREMASPSYRSERCGRIVEALHKGMHVLAFTCRTPHHEHPGSETLAESCAALLRVVIERAAPRRIGIAGGDTSSLGVHALKPWGLSCLATLASGVTVCRVHSDDPATHRIELMLKGGQMGGAELFEDFVAGIVR